MSSDHLVMFGRIVTALTFALAAFGKAADLASFREAIVDFELLPRKLAAVAALVFVAAELAVVLSMVVGDPLLLEGFLLATFLLTGFSAALLVTLRRRKRIACNCFGRAEQRISGYDVARNSLLSASSLGAAWASRLPPTDLPIAEAIAMSLIAICFFVLSINMAPVAETLRRPFQVG